MRYKGIAAALGLLGVYTLFVRPRIQRWGATDEEATRSYPGADIIPGAERSGAMAITIDAPPRNVWRYLIQMGVDRGGWYSWDNLDNWGRTSTDRIHPEWQHAKVGDHFYSMPDKSEWWEVAALEPERFLALRASVDMRGRTFDPHDPAKKPRYYTDSIWGFQLLPLEGDRTRLIVSGYWDLQPRWLETAMSLFVLEPSHWIMQMRQFKKLKRYAERDAKEERELLKREYVLDGKPVRERYAVDGAYDGTVPAGVH